MLLFPIPPRWTSCTSVSPHRPTTGSGSFLPFPALPPQPSFPLQSKMPPPKGQKPPSLSRWPETIINENKCQFHSPATEPRAMPGRKDFPCAGTGGDPPQRCSAPPLPPPPPGPARLRPPRHSLTRAATASRGGPGAGGAARSQLPPPRRRGVPGRAGFGCGRRAQCVAACSRPHK